MDTQTDRKNDSLTNTNDNNELNKSVEDGELHGDGLDSEKGDEEDVPDDFFDDFANDDFMDGLDIVDAWDETEKKKKAGRDDSKNEHSKQSARSREPKARSREREKRKRSSERRRRSRENRYKNEPPSKRRDPDISELRRDPSKTRRDMERDRENYTKKKEQKYISKVVETGLVPPGMETEVDITYIEKEAETKRRDSIPVEEHSSRERELKRDRSRERRRRRSRSFDRVGPYRGWSRGRSGERRRERSSGRRNRSRERWNSRGKDDMNRMDDGYSPYRSRRRRSSSDRDRWLRRSNSPERKYMTRPNEERMSFLEELKIKLESQHGPKQTLAPVEYPFLHNSSQTYVPPPTNMYPVPIPVTPNIPGEYCNPNPQYDQNFFIGDHPANNYPMNGPPAPVLPPSNYSGVGVAPAELLPTPGVGPVPAPSASAPQQMDSVSKLMEQIRAVTNSKLNNSGNAAQLLQDKKLSLTDFLSIKSRPPAFSSNPEALQKKVNVLSRCQDVLKELTGDKKFGGKLIVTKTRRQGPEPKLTNVSPLLRKVPVKFSYSTPLVDDDKVLFNKILNRALVKAKIIKEVVELDDEEEDEPVVISPAPSLQAMNQKKVPSNVSSDKMKRVLTKKCQTDRMECKDCQKRKLKQFKSIGIQCGESERYNVGVQVNEADIAISKIPKNQSLASLTPAQLLGRAEPTSTRVENFGTAYGRPASNFYDPFEYETKNRDSRRFEYQNQSYSSSIGDPRKFPRF